MTATMRGPRAKIERAKKHVAELEAALGDLAFKASTHPDVIVEDYDSQPGKRLYKVGEIPEIPDHIAAIAGDAIHNLRSSLDLLYCQLVLANGKSISQSDEFPIKNTRQKFESRCETEIQRRVGQQAMELIRATEAYRGGNGDPLWRVHKLDIEDKHRLLYVLGLRLRGTVTPFPLDFFPARGSEWLREKMKQPIKFFPAAPLNKGDVLFIDNYPTKPQEEPEFLLDVAFNESQVVQGQSLLPTLMSYTQAVDLRVEKFAAFPKVSAKPWKRSLGTLPDE